MIVYLTEDEAIDLHARLIVQSGGSPGLRDRGALQSSLAQPLLTFGGADLYPSLADKAAALGWFLICNHPFVDGNKRIGHAAMETFLVLNGFELIAGVDEQETIILQIAAGQLKLDVFTQWVQQHILRKT